MTRQGAEAARRCSDAGLRRVGGGNWSIAASCTTLDISFRSLDADAVALALPSSHVSVLNLTWSALNASEVARVATAVSGHSTLRVLDLSGNWIGDSGAASLFKALAQGGCGALEVLHLRWNGITQSSIKEIVLSLHSCRHLLTLDLGGNMLTSIQPMLQSLLDSQAVSSVRDLRLDMNLIGSPGVGQLVSFLSSNSSLTALNLASNKIETLATGQLLRSLEHNARMLRLDLRGNHIPYAARSALIAVMDSRPPSSKLLLDAVGHEQSKHPSNGTRAHPLLGTFEARERLVEMLDSFSSDTAHLALYQPGAGGSEQACLDSLNVWTQEMLSIEERMSQAAPRSSWYHHFAHFRSVQLAVLSNLHRSNWRGRLQLPTCNSSITRLAMELSSRDAVDAHELAYWRQVYPMAGPLTSSMLKGKNLNFWYNSAPPSILATPCEQHSWSRCRLDNFMDGLHGEVRMPKILLNSFFSPFRLPPGACLRSLFSWDNRSIDNWRASYPYADGVPDDSWAEVVHTKEQTGSSWLYLTPGSGIFWNCGRSLRARNKVAAVLQLVQQLRGQAMNDSLHYIARAIETDDRALCDQDHCRIFTSMLRSNRTDRNDNCYGRCRLVRAPLTHWLARAASTQQVYEWQFEHMSASSVFDSFISALAVKLGYDTVQLTMQPQVWCGIGWTTEIVDLRVRHHKAKDVLPYLSVRDPLRLEHGAPCIVPTDDLSTKAFQLCIFCEGTMLERVARCLADASFGKPGFTVYSQYPHDRFKACVGS